jgi:uncharacterized protein YuzE
MKLLYFADTDTLTIGVRDEAVSSTEDLTDDVLVDYNTQRQVVSLTIEDAAQQVDLSTIEVNGLLPTRVHARSGASPLRYEPGVRPAGRRRVHHAARHKGRCHLRPAPGPCRPGLLPPVVRSTCPDCRPGRRGRTWVSTLRAVVSILMTYKQG